MIPAITLKDWIIIGLIVAFGTTGALWWRARDERLRMQGAYQVQLAIADSLRADATVLKAIADSAKGVSDSVRTVEDPRIAAAARERDRALGKANEAQGRLDAIARAIAVKTGPDSVVVLRAIRESNDSILNQVVAPLRFAQVRSDSIIASQAREITSLNATVERTNAALVKATDALNARVAADSSLVKSTPGGVTKFLEKAAYLLGGGGIGYLIAKD